MRFIGQINLPEAKTPTRAYVHEAGIGAYITSGEPFHVDSITPIQNARRHLEEVLTRGLVVPQNLQYMIAILWGNEDKEKVVDCFGFSGIQGFPHWPGNPEVQSWVLINGVYHHNPEIQRNITCGDGLLILGQEEGYRRHCKTLESYLQNPPPLIRVSAVNVLPIE